MEKIKKTYKDDEYRTCTCCGKTFPNTKEYFAVVNKGKIGSVCRECLAIKRKEYNKKRRERFDTNEIEYDGEKTCIRCGRSLPNSYRFFPVDKGTSTGLRNICRECSNNFKGFLVDGKELNQKWTDEENDLLKKIHMDYSGRELHELFFHNHSLNSIRTQIRLLGLSGKSDLGKESGNRFRSNKINPATGRKYIDDWREKLSIGIKKYYETHDSVWKGKSRPEISELMSEIHKGNWSGESNPRHLHPLYGSHNSNWKGGITSIYTALRSRIKDWSNNSYKFCCGRCVITGLASQTIHHTTSFSSILDEVFCNTKIRIMNKINDYSNDELLVLDNEMNRLHNFYGIGACMDDRVHRLFHSIYGYREFSPLDFLDFIYRIDCGEFDEWFEENNIPININYEYVEYLEGILYNMKSA